MKKTIYLLLGSLIIISCNNSEMIHFSIDVILKEKVSNVNENDPLPKYITKLVNPIESIDTFYIPDVTIKRLDLPKEKPFKIEVPSITENSIKKTLGTYDYDNLMEDYSENLPKMLCGIYLTTKGNDNLAENVLDVSDALVYYLNTNNLNSVDSTILIYSEEIKRNGGGKVIIYFTPGAPNFIELPSKDSMVSATKQVTKPGTKTISLTSTKTKKIPIGDYATYEGSVNSRGEMCSKVGRLVFKKRALIEINDPSKRFAEIGDFVVGEWINGHISHGKWFDSSGKMKESILIGTGGVCD